ncbi:MAG: ribonuclease H-like domain-containing protein [bacterium]
MSKVVFDIETSGTFESLDKEAQEYLLKYAEGEDEVEEARKKVNLWPFCSQIVALALFNPDTEKGKVYFQAPDKEIAPFSENGADFKPCSEKEILENFWQDIKNYHQFITFNGRGFDCPYIMLRSAVLGVRPTKNLMPPRFSADFHIDLLDQLTFYSAFRKFSLDFYCRGFGIKSPKAGGMTGDKMVQYFKDGKFLDIARYCFADTKATAELYKRWTEYIEM